MLPPLASIYVRSYRMLFTGVAIIDELHSFDNNLYDYSSSANLLTTKPVWEDIAIASSGASY